MAGERWAQVRELLAGLNVTGLRSAADDWDRRRDVMQLVTRTQATPDITLQQAGAVAVASRELLRDAEQAYEAVTGMYNMAHAPGRILEDLAVDIQVLRLQMEREEEGGPFGFNARPDPAVVPVTTAMRMARDLLLYEYDQQADVYLMRLRETVAAAAAKLDRTVPLSWPRGLPRADPDAPPG